jgi:hypothetical protein
MTNSASVDGSVRELPLSAGGEIELYLTSNNARIRATDEDKVVIRTLEGEPVDEVLTIEATEDRVAIRDAGGATSRDLRLGPIRIRSISPADLDLEIPATARLSLKTMSGDVEAIGIGAASRWASASGDLRLRIERGPIGIESMSGDITVESQEALEVQASSVSGDLRVRAPRIDKLAASSTSGDIRIAAALATGFGHGISSVSGDVVLETGSPVRLEAQTVTGEIRSSGPHRAEGGRGRRTIVIGDGSVALTVRTMSGDISVRQGLATTPEGPVAPARPAASVAPAAPRPAAAPVPPTPPAPAFVVAEAEAAPNLVRPAARATGDGDAGDAGLPDADLDGDLEAELDEADAALEEAEEELDRVAADLDAELGAGSHEGAPATSTTAAVPTAGAPSATDRREAARLDVLRALERGDLDIEAASRRLEALEDAGPRYFRGWC